MIWRNLFRDRIVSAREAERMSQVDAARAIGVSPRQLSYCEAGDKLPSLDRLREMCLTYNTSADALLGLRECVECGRTHEESRISKQGTCGRCASEAA